MAAIHNRASAHGIKNVLPHTEDLKQLIFQRLSQERHGIVLAVPIIPAQSFSMVKL